MTAHQPPAKGPVETYPAQAKRRHLQAVLEEQLLDAIYEGLDFAKSYIASMMEACKRDDRQELSMRRRQISAALRQAFEAHAELNGGAK